MSYYMFISQTDSA